MKRIARGKLIEKLGKSWVDYHVDKANHLYNHLKGTDHGPDLSRRQYVDMYLQFEYSKYLRTRGRIREDERQ